MIFEIIFFKISDWNYGVVFESKLCFLGIIILFNRLFNILDNGCFIYENVNWNINDINVINIGYVNIGCNIYLFNFLVKDLLLFFFFLRLFFKIFLINLYVFFLEEKLNLL